MHFWLMRESSPSKGLAPIFVHEVLGLGFRVWGFPVSLVVLSAGLVGMGRGRRTCSVLLRVF